MEIDPIKIIKALEKKGFRKEPTSNHKKHIFYCLYDVNGQPTRIKTWFSHNGDPIGDSLLQLMRNQLGNISKPQLMDLIECPLSYEEYIELLKKNNKIS